MSDSFKICAVGIVFAIICVLIKNYRGEFLIPVRLASTVVIFGVAVILISPVIKFLNSIMGQTLPLEYMEIILKTLAIAYMTQISGELCRECGENSIAFGIETVGKIEIVVLSLPLINNVLIMSKEFLEW